MLSPVSGVLQTRSHIKRKADISCFMSVRLSVCLSAHMLQHDSHWSDFREIWYCEFLRKSVEKPQTWFITDKNIGHLIRRPKYVYIVDRITKYLVAREQRTGKSFLRFHGVVRAERDGTRAETTFRLSFKRTSPFKSAGESVQSTAGSRSVGISVSNAGYTTLRGRVRVLATHSIRQFPLHFPTRASPCAITFRRQYNNIPTVFILLKTTCASTTIKRHLLFWFHSNSAYVNALHCYFLRTLPTLFSLNRCWITT